MFTPVTTLVLSAALTFLMVMFAASLRTRLWTPSGFRVAAGNREGMAEPSGFVGRADRAAKNMLENMVLFVALVAAAHFAGAASSQGAVTGANVFFWARVAYWLAYLAGVPYLRTAIWGVSVVGLVLIGVAAI